MTKKKTHEEYESELCHKEIDYYPSEKYIDSKTPILHECILCNHSWKVKPAAVLTGSGCPNCDRIKRTKTTDQYLEELSSKNITIVPLEDYINSTTKIIHSCVYGHEWTATPDSILQFHGCPYCSGTKKYTQAEYVEAVATIDPNIKVLGEYINNNSPILHECFLGHQWKTRPSNILQGKSCPTCNKSGSFTGSYFDKRPEKVNTPAILYLIVLIDKQTSERVCLKIGITQGTSFKHISKRAKGFTGYTYAVLKVVKGPLQKIYELEQSLHKKWAHKKYKSPWKFGGYTELFELDDEIIRSVPKTP